MNFIDAIVLGFIQGLTEFLPISSKSHLILGQKLLGLPTHDLTMDLVLHIGTLFAIFTIFRNMLKELIVEGLKWFKHRQVTPHVKLIALVILGTLPAGIIGLLFKDYFEELLTNLLLMGVLLMVLGVFLFFTRRLPVTSFRFQPDNYKESMLETAEIGWKKALIVGFAQSLALLPGVSRSGSTILAGLFSGLPRHAAAVFSFLLSIPIIMAAALLQFKDANWSEMQMQPVFAGLISSYLFGLFGLWLVLRQIKKGRLDVFSYYLWLLGPFCIYLHFS